MRVTNLLHFTENHRFTVYRDFTLSALANKTLIRLYQPMVGALAISFYLTLVYEVHADEAGYSPLEQQRKLFLTLGFEPGEKHRKLLVDQASLLEAIGLLQTSRKFVPQSDDYVFIYQLIEPLPPGEFFKNQHLLLLLRDKVGKQSVLQLGRELIAMEPDELKGANEENLSVPFYELFRLNTKVIDHELEQAFYEMAPARAVSQEEQAKAGYKYTDIITRMPKTSRNRAFVEELKYRQDELARINYIAQKYDLKLQELSRLLDEDDTFSADGSVDLDALQIKASQSFDQEMKRDETRTRYMAKVDAQHSEPGGEAIPEEKPVEMAFYLEVPAMFQGQCDIHQYNMLMRNEPYTQVLKRFFPKGQVPEGVRDIFAKVDLVYKLSEEVINVMIHFLHTDKRSWAKSSIEYVASDLLGKQVTTYEQAVQYVREQLAYRARTAAKSDKRKSAGTGSYPRSQTKKPNIPIIQNVPDDPLPTEEEFAAMRRKAQKLDGKIK
jgi:replication initiation and membrane attachment protein